MSSIRGSCENSLRRGAGELLETLIQINCFLAPAEVYRVDHAVIANGSQYENTEVNAAIRVAGVRGGSVVWWAMIRRFLDGDVRELGGLPGALVGSLFEQVEVLAVGLVVGWVTCLAQRYRRKVGPLLAPAPSFREPAAWGLLDGSLAWQGGRDHRRRRHRFGDRQCLRG